LHGAGAPLKRLPGDSGLQETGTLVAIAGHIAGSWSRS